MKKILWILIFISILTFGGKNVLAAPGVDFKPNVVCKRSDCSDTYGCTLNRCLSTDPIEITCAKCKPVGKGFDQNCDFCQFSTPTPVPKTKIILIPGYGVAWSYRAMILDMTIKNDEWEWFSLSKKYYSGFKELMKNNNYSLDKDYFIWLYDWRKPVASIVNDFKQYYSSKIGPNDRVIIVGHSLGGVVGRIFVHDNPTLKIDKLIAVGSPQKGSLEAYDAWVYGVSKDPAINILISVKNVLRNLLKLPPSNVEIVKNTIPMVKDLLPAFDFIKLRGVLYDYRKWSVRNDYLIAKNSEKDWDLKGKIYSIVGNGKSTWDSYNLNTSGYDVSNEGDGVVLKKSAGIGSNVIEIANETHARLVNGGIGEIAKLLGMNKESSLITFANNTEEDTPVVFLAYQGSDLTVKCGNEDLIKMDSSNMIMVGGGKKICKVTAKADSNGLIKIIIGRTDRKGNWIIKNKSSFDIDIDLLNDKLKSDDLTVPTPTLTPTSKPTPIPTMQAGSCKCSYVGHCAGVKSFPTQTCNTCNLKCKDSKKCLAKTTIIGMGDFLGNCRGASFNFIDYCENPDKYKSCDFYKQVDPCMCCNANWGSLGCTKSTWKGL